MCKKVVFSFVLVVSLILTGLAATAQAKPIVLTYSNFFPSAHVQSLLAQDWCKEVEKRTNGRVTVQYFPGQTLTKARQSYDGVVMGMSDLAMGCFAYTRGRFPVMEVVDLPLGYSSGAMATKVVNEVFAKLNPKELADTQVMYLHAHGPGLLHTKDRPVRTLEDVKGLKIRATGTSAKVAAALGGTPVAMPMPDTYQALSRGVVDGSLYPVESNLGWKLGEVTKFCTRHFNMAYTTSFFVVMNKARWQSLPDDIKKIIAQINAEWVAKTAAAWDQADTKGIEFFKSLKGREFIELSPEEAARWKQAVQPVLSDYATAMDKRGLKGKEVLKAAQEAVAKHSTK